MVLLVGYGSGRGEGLYRVRIHQWSGGGCE